MRIAILASVALPVPPPFQGGTEWIAYYQAKGLGERGHQILCFGAEGSAEGPYALIPIGSGDTVAGSSHATPEAGVVESSRKLRKEAVYWARVAEQLVIQKEEYDIILNNMRGAEAVLLPVASWLKKPFVPVCHLPLFEDLATLFLHYRTPVVTISNAQRKDFPHLAYAATIPNAVDTKRYSYHETPGDYLLMMGSIAPHKNQAAAIRIAKRLGMKLVLAGKIGVPAYFDELKKDIDGTQIRWIGELPFKEKLKLYQNAKALLFPIAWEEPFGLVMIEAGSCGTPVVAYGNGAVPEVVVDGTTGFVIEPGNEDGMVEAVQNIQAISRADCRKHVEEAYTIEKMIDAYETMLRKVSA